ncbi:Re/Si-specific NAD(P)(+) transhydrogenase subunit alpha [Corynebacterium sp. 3HC-13]|uniref:Re/Si-specific NAD(P)(+) transhydrogenase subunit alpha n=1 Tax=Corynebacterium poyangense TaxID=2684405 RepID=UPI001CCAABD3|nr:Re/Si-specific NAD(P)(+) transhydrogenase subunit alpha [Corynebacterium poyangense]MBZ8176357.1 Re/Si-specific NAD(P)(+) transhydrogenase subunit alpha [Corynebacterium poyangense]
MHIGVPRDPHPDQRLVATTPETIASLKRLGYEVAVEKGAGTSAHFPDQAYHDAGAELVDSAAAWGADIVLCLDQPPLSALELMKPGALLISRLAPATSPEFIEQCRQHRITAMAMDAVPRLSRAQSMDVLSSMANIAGYRAVIEAASEFGRLFTGQVTAAGKLPPAQVYVIGAGVAGLAAIGTAQSMGAVVKATDVRPETAEQVQSMGAEFVAIPVATEESEDGYAKEMTADQARAAAILYAEQAARADIVITTANIPGRRSPVLLTAADVAQMRPGSVIVDMAAQGGGNCELTQPGQVVETDNGVKIIGYTDLAGRLPAQASHLYAKNLANFLALLTPDKDGCPQVNLDDDIIRGVCLCQGENILWPPPPVKVSAAPAPADQKAVAEPAVPAEEKTRRSPLLWIGLATILAVVLMAFSPAAVASHYVVLMLAIVVGFYVITSVTHSLHTPLMSETNAISGIIVVGALPQIGSPHLAVQIISMIAIFVASINIFGGFTVTHRMLTMFRKDS